MKMQIKEFKKDKAYHVKTDELINQYTICFKNFKEMYSYALRLNKILKYTSLYSFYEVKTFLG